MTAKLAQMVEQRRAELRRAVKPQSMPMDAYAASVKVNFVAVLERQLRKCRSAA